MRQAPFLLLMVDDLMVASRLEATARHLGYAVRSAHSTSDFWAAIEAGPSLVLLGTHATRLPWRELLATLRERPLAAPVLAFGSHQDAATRADARQAGVTRWVPNSRLVTELPALIHALATGPAPLQPE